MWLQKGGEKTFELTSSLCSNPPRVLQSLDKCGLWKLRKTFYNSVENCSKLSKALELKIYVVYKGGQSLKHKIERSIDISPNKFLIL